MTDRRAASRRFPARLVCAACLAGSLLASSGCNITGPALYLLSDDRTPAVHTLNPDAPTVVFIDDRASVLPSRTVRTALARAAEKVLLENKLVKADVISSDSLQQVVAGERFGRPRSVAEIGRAVGADQVIYATVDRFTLSPDGSQYAPAYSLRVKVIDAKSGDRLFPRHTSETQDSFYTLALPEKTSAESLPRSTAELSKAQLALAEDAGRRLGELFYKHSSRDPNSKVGGI